MSSAVENLGQVHAELREAVRRSGRSLADITLIAVSKTVSSEAIAPLLAAGHRQFGENRVQEAQGKWPALKLACSGIVLHLVGSLQSNKASDAVALFDIIHSLDRSSLAKALAQAMAQQRRRPDLFVQVNIGEEAQKGGVAIEALPALLAEARALDLPVIGLMAIPPADREAAPYFALLAKLAYRHGLTQLSMGMSSDFSSAIQQGATHVRVGTAIFGARQPELR